ncbi:hypothetical protein ABN028_32960 [Actinopolymorpha sp. B17G11]|uniref:hypothetical protein n=1 Tax=Actinopolymorpha sp. B17G11 TaxID=3160861 RepID=UPI0032E439F4
MADVASDNLVLAGGCGGAWCDAVGPAGFDVDLPAEAVVAEGLVESVDRCPIPQVPPARGSLDGDGTVLRSAWPGVCAAAEVGEEAEGVAAVPVAAGVVPVVFGDGFTGEVDAGQEPGGQVGG